MGSLNFEIHKTAAPTSSNSEESNESAPVFSEKLMKRERQLYKRQNPFGIFREFNVQPKILENPFGEFEEFDISMDFDQKIFDVPLRIRLKSLPFAEHS